MWQNIYIVDLGFRECKAREWIDLRQVAILLSVTVAGLVLWLCWSSLGVIAIPIAGLAGLVSVVIALSYAELVRLITDIMTPE